MANFQFTKIRETGRSILVQLLHSQAAVVPVYTGWLLYSRRCGSFFVLAVRCTEDAAFACDRAYNRSTGRPDRSGKTQAAELFQSEYAPNSRDGKVQAHSKSTRNRRPRRSPCYSSAWLKPAVSRTGVL